MKALLFCSLLVLVVGCIQYDEEFKAYAYDGKYPVTLTGERIRTYTPTILGGTINVSFKGQPWNHAPYLSLHITEIDSSLTNDGKYHLSIGIYSKLTNPSIEPCVLEGFHIQLPAKQSRFVFSKELTVQDETGANFYTLDCDATTGRYKLDPNRENWVDIKRYDPVSKIVEAQFSTHFVPENRTLMHGPVYPLHFDLSGSVKGVAQVLKK